jgi:hypothetical protein
VDFSLYFFGVAFKLERSRIAIEDNGQATGASRLLKQGFERFSFLCHHRPTRRADAGLSEAVAFLEQMIRPKLP